MIKNVLISVALLVLLGGCAKKEGQCYSFQGAAYMKIITLLKFGAIVQIVNPSLNKRGEIYVENAILDQTNRMDCAVMEKAYNAATE